MTAVVTVELARVVEVAEVDHRCGFELVKQRGLALQASEVSEAVLQPAFLQGEVVMVALVLSEGVVVAALSTESAQTAVAGQVSQRQAALEQRHPAAGAESRQCSGVDS